MLRENLLLSAQHGVDPKIVVGGLTPLTTIDYPGELAAVIFLQGCPWSCGYCQNQDLLGRDSDNTIPWNDVISFLGRRRHLLDAVVFSGGEPTVHVGLSEAMQQVRSMGYKIGLHTAGIYPDRLKRVLPLADWVGMDIKAAKADYERITRVKNSGERAWESAKILINSGIEHEFRTTVHPDMLGEENISSLIEELIAIGAKHYVVQECVIQNCLDINRRHTSSPKPDQGLLDELTDTFDTFSVRAA